MSYTPTTWASGDTITAAGLNKMEQGIANAGNILVVNVTDEVGDKTAGEIFSAFQSSIVIFRYSVTENDYYIDLCVQASFDSEEGYHFYTLPSSGRIYVAPTDDAYAYIIQK